MEEQEHSKEEFEKIFEEVKSSALAIEQIRSNAHGKVQSIETFYSGFERLRNQIEDGDTGLAKVFEDVKTTKREIDQIRESSQARLEEINSQATSVIEKVKAIENFYSDKFIKIKADIEDEKSGLQATLGAAQELKNQIVKAKSGADESFREIKNLSDESKKLRDQSELSTNAIESLKNASIELKNSIGETLDLVTSSSLTESFIRRRDRISKSVSFWNWFTIGSVVALGVSVLFIYYLQSTAIDGFKDWHSWYRYLFISPLIYLSYLCSKNYRMERDYEEKYAFKTVLSASIQAYIKLLDDKFPDKKDDLFKFALKSIDQIYQEPYSDKNESNEVYGGFRNIFNFGIKSAITGKKDSNMTNENNQSKDKSGVSH